MAIGSRFIAPLLVVCLLLPAALFFAETASAEGDLYIGSVDVVQVLPQPRGLVVNKSAGIRITVVSSFDAEVRADIRVTYNHGLSSYTETGPDGYGVPLAPGINTVYLPGGNCTAHPMNWTSDPAKFMWTSPGADPGVMVEIDPDDSIFETDEANNQMIKDPPVEAWLARGLRILVVPIYNDEHNRPYYYSFSLEEELQEVLDLFPIPDDGLEVVEAAPRNLRYDSTLWSDCAAVTKTLSAEARALGYDHVVAVFPRVRDIWGVDTYGSAVGCLDDPRDPVPLFITITGINSREALLAHELGHEYYLWHPHDLLGLSVYAATKYSVRERVYGVSANTVMSYPSSLPIGVPVTPRWIDNERYQDYLREWLDLSMYEGYPEGTYQWNLFSQFVDAPRIPLPVTIVQGAILKSGQAVMTRPWFSVPFGVPEEQMIPQQGPEGMYSVRLLDSLRGILGNTYFNVLFKGLMHMEGEDSQYLTQDSDRADFVLNVPTIPGTRYVQILDPDEVVLYEREVSSSTPTVLVSSPNGGEVIDIGETQEISWTSEDMDGDDLSYFVSYTLDDGDTWIPIASNLTATSYSWNTTGVAPTGLCRVKVMASDGFNTGEDSSDLAFKLKDSAPPVTTVGFEGVLGENNWYVSGVEVLMTAVDNSRVSRTEYSFDNITWTAYGSSLRLTDEGIKTLYYRSRDLAGNLEQVISETVRIDLMAPSLTIASPVEGSSVDQDVTFSWMASDSVSGVAKCEVRLDSGAWTYVGTSVQWEASDLTEGMHKFEVRATDFAGNSATASVEFSYGDSSGIALWALALAVGAVVTSAVLIGIYIWRKRSG